MQFRTDRLTLRRPTASDLDAMVVAINHFDVARWVHGVPHPYTQADAVDYLDTVNREGTPAWSIFENGQLVGGVGIPHDFGYWLTPSAWGRGIATEASRAVLNWYFDQSADDLATQYLVGNVGSARVLSKLGFREMGASTCSSLAAGENLPAIRCVLTKADWESKR